MSKGLGAPIGAMLIGNQVLINQARAWRKMLGGGMRQAGFIAAAGIFALDNNIARLKEDHNKAKQISEVLSHCTFVKEVLPVETNIVVFKLKDNINDIDFLKNLESNGVRAVGFGPQTIRMVTHLDFTEQMFETLILVLKKL